MSQKLATTDKLRSWLWYDVNCYSQKKFILLYEIPVRTC